MANEQNLKPCKKGETHNPNGRPKKISRQIASIPEDAQRRIYGILHAAIATGSAEKASELLSKGAQDLPEYGFILQLAVKELLGKNGWMALNDILDRLFGKAKIITDAVISTDEAGLLIGFKKADD